MHWIIQDSPYEEEGHRKLQDLLTRLEIPHTEVKVVPFSHEIIPEPIAKNPIIVMGTMTLCSNAIWRCWKPGVFINENFTYQAYLDHYGGEMLNNDAIICQFGEVGNLPNLPYQFFIRPAKDGKEFAGMIRNKCECESWVESIKKIGEENYTTLDILTPVVVAPLKEILREYRFFVVDGKVVTGSRYKINDRVVYSTEVDDAEAYAQQMVDIWQPARAFVLDIARTPEAYKVLEINCFNSAGYYAADVGKIIEAVESMGY